MITVNRNKIALITGFAILSLIFQPAAFASSLTDANLNALFTIQVGKTVEIKSERLTITLTDISDSRCPTDVTCVWEGEIALNLIVKKGGDKSKESSLEIKTSQSSKVLFENYSIELSDVEPYPVSTMEIKKEDYVVNLVVKNQKDLSPLKQFKQGISLDEIKCRDSLTLIQKNNHNPACVKPETAEKLLARGWALDTSLINSFEGCAAAGNPVMESYPRQCRTSDGKHFVEEIDSRMMSPESLCQKYSGNWLAEFNECETISSEQCSTMNGMFKECESACRHIPDAEACTTQCVPVCVIP